MHDTHQAIDLPSLRKQKILLLLERDGKVTASHLVDHFAVSQDTIRRDLGELAAAGLLQRVHGGALPRPKDTGKDFFTRVGETNEAKRSLAQRAAERVEDGQIVLFDSGSTTLQIAQSLPHSIRLTVVTTSPMIAIALADHRDVKVILAGGPLNPATLSTGGHEAIRLIQSIKADLLFTGVCALHPQVGMSTLHFDEVAVKQALLDSASHVVAVTMADKLGAVEPFVVAPCNRIHTLITEWQVPGVDVYEQLGLEVLRVEVE
ncbi:DeoR family transcriptional regulator [Pseudomonas fluorescens]|uniref:DeoR/GlpR transcriptional regulator n=1 Tax=Pseudomonas lactucae TaxID=2813360 RepID=A0A9X1C8M4_9PSED|nr:DeoR/GlpR family DNA-binding transcription regulator [Pseudomonas lactucae]OPA89304.1 DeoR family transcriptional regulator [Pseudomonas fluorescens]MBN2978833.1 DeoR/GlpR transcriptional regulator [Pseudomonas lactucae]MBN2989329.1 DeoR/GlpR transcriptional regulator [Pseudomonas lactucae]OPB08616.1 DeoR family transcriptional regulator [Pseudomonas fluorescens]OPB19570.1 DeoR family transcriptional regulator [Pseudomonas fluorescens]